MDSAPLDLGFGTVPSGLSPHVGAFYRSLEERDAILKTFYEKGLAAGDPCLLICPKDSRTGYLAAFRKSGLATAKALKSGQFRILDAEEFYLRKGVFDPDQVIASARLLTRDLKPGQILRSAGDMSWTLLAGVSPEAAAAYEERLNREVFAQHPVAGLCLYDMRRFGFAWGKVGYDTHPHIVFGERFFENTRHLTA